MIFYPTAFLAFAWGIFWGDQGGALGMGLLPLILPSLTGAVMNRKRGLGDFLLLWVVALLAFLPAYSSSAARRIAEEQAERLVGAYEGDLRIIRTTGDESWIGELQDRIGTKVLVRGRGPFHPGDLLQAQGRLLRPGEGMNRGSFDYRDYLRHKGISLILAVEKGRMMGRVRDPLSCLETYRASFMKRMEKCLGEDAGYIQSIFLGDGSAMGEEALEAWRGMGIAHLQAVSGSQAGVLLDLILFLHILTPGRHFLKRLAFLSIFLAYGFLTDSPSVWRVILSAGMAGFWHLAGWEGEPLDFLFLGGLLQLVCRPGDLFSLSFQLSFMIALGLGFFQGFLKERRVSSQILLAGVLSLAFSLPLSLSSFQEAPLGGILFTPLAAPLVQGIIIGSSIYFLFPVPPDLLLPLTWFLKADIRILEGMVNLGSRMWLPVLQGRPWPAVGIAAYYAGLIGLSRGLKKFAICCGALVLMSFLFSDRGNMMKEGEIQVIFLNVGQGDAVLVRGQKGGSFLIDGGPPGAGEREVAPYLRRLGIFKLDIALGTHGDQDHIGGLQEVLQEIPARLFLMPSASTDREGRFHGILDAHRGRVKELTAGMEFSFEGIIIKVLAPRAGIAGDERNDTSIVLELSFEGGKVLLTGDCSLEIMEKAAGNGPYEIVKVPHHGSGESWEPGLYSQLGAGLAIISVGPNRYGHPKGELLQDLNQGGIPFLRTDRRKDIRLRILRGEIMRDLWKGEVKTGLR